MPNQCLTVVGGGQMGRALVAGMLKSNVLATSDIRVVEPSEVSRKWWSDHHPDIQTTSDLAAGVADANIVLLAVKPNVIGKVTSQSNHFFQDRLVVSIAAGVSISSLCGGVGHQRVVRVMPNTPCLVGQGVSAYCCAENVTADDRKWLHSAFGSVGLAVEVEESQMDAVTGLSGSGPAYLCLIIESLADGGVMAGLPRTLAMQLATQMVLGTAAMIAETGKHPGELKDAVASPGGTTIAALRVLEENGVRAAMINAVLAAANRSRELA